jgi:hypothetical protein
VGHGDAVTVTEVPRGERGMIVEDVLACGFSVRSPA